MSAQLDALRSFVAGRPVGMPNAAPNGNGPHVLVVGSGKGGAGTSVVAALLALAAAAAGRRVLLVDTDPHVGPQRYLLGIGPSASLADLRGDVDVASLARALGARMSLPDAAVGSPAAVAAQTLGDRLLAELARARPTERAVRRPPAPTYAPSPPVRSTAVPTGALR